MSYSAFLERKTQSSLFDPDVYTRVRSPMCAYTPHCGATALLGPEDDRGECIHRDIVCEHCGRRGVESTRKDLR